MWSLKFYVVSDFQFFAGVSTHGSQCGFCTRGFIMSMYALLRSSKTVPGEEQIEEALA